MGILIGFVTGVFTPIFIWGIHHIVTYRSRLYFDPVRCFWSLSDSKEDIEIYNEILKRKENTRPGGIIVMSKKERDIFTSMTNRIYK